MRSTTRKTYVGIDVAKDRLDIAVRPTGEYLRATNDERGAARPSVCPPRRSRGTLCGMREGLPRTVVAVLTGAFALSLFCLLSLFAYLAVSKPPTVALERVGGALVALLLTAGLSGACSLTSGLLALHYGREAYGSGEEVLFRSCLIVSGGILLCSGLWALGILVLG